MKLTITWKARGIRNLRESRFAFERLRHVGIDLRTEALRTASTGVSGLIPISSEELQKARL